MKCSLKFKGVVDSYLPKEIFQPTVFTDKIKVDIFKQLHRTDVVKVLGGEPSAKTYRFEKDLGTDNVYAVRNDNLEYIKIKPKEDFHKDAEVQAVIAKRRPSKLDNFEKVNNLLLKKLNKESKIDNLILTSLHNTTAKINVNKNGMSDATKSIINLSMREVEWYGNSYNLNTDTAVKQVILHELVHSNTVATLEAAIRGDKAAQLVAKNLYDLHKKYLTISKNQKFYDKMQGHDVEYGIEEFIANAVSSKEFQDYLNKNSQSILGKILEAIKDLLGIRTFSDDIIQEYLDIMKYDVHTRKATPESKVYNLSAGEASYYESGDHNKSHIMMNILKGDQDIITQYENGKELDYYKSKATGNKISRLTSDKGVAAKHSDTAPKTMEEINEITISKHWDANNIPRDTPRFMVAREPEMTADQYVTYINTSREKSQLRGRIIHMILEKIAAEKAGIATDAELETIYERDVARFESIEKDEKKTNFSWVSTMAEKYFKVSGLDLNNKDKITGHTILLETIVKSEVLDFASKVDILGQRNIDGKLLLLDTKTGSNVLSSSFKRVLNHLSPSYAPIFSNARDKAKLELMLRAVAIKEQNPDAQFYQLKIGNFQNGTEAARRQKLDVVDVVNYLDFLKRIYKSKKMTDELGLTDASTDKTLYDQLIEKSPLIFEASEYIDNIDPMDINYAKNGTAEEILKEEIQDYNDSVANSYLSEHSEVQKKLAQQAEHILKKTTVSDEDWEKEYGDLSLIQATLGNYQDTKLPIVRAWAKRYQEALAKNNEEIGNIKTKLENLTEDLIKEYQKKNNRISLGRNLRNLPITTAKNQGLFDFAYTTEVVNGATVERLVQGPTVIDKKTIPADDEYNLLTDIQKKYLDFVNSLTKEASDFMNRKQYKVNLKRGDNIRQGVELSALDMFNNTQDINNTVERRGMEKGFFYKFSMTPQERRQVAYNPGNKKNLNQTGGFLGVVKGEYENLKRRLTHFDDDHYNADRENNILVPIKGLGSPKIDANQLYTKDLTFSTLQGITNYVRKKNFDQVALLGHGVQHWLNVNHYEKQQDFKHYQTFFKNKLTRNVLGVTRRTTWNTNPVLINFKDEYGNRHSMSLSIDKVIKGLMRFGTASIMPLRIFQPIGTGIQALLTLSRDVASNSIYSKFNKNMKKEYDNYNLSALGRAHGELVKLSKDNALGNFRRNKAFLLMRNTGYLPKSYEGFVDRSGLPTSQMRLLSNDMMYVMQTASEDVITYLTLISQMMSKTHTGVDPETGKLVTKSMYDWYSVNGQGELQWDGGLRGYEESKYGGEPTEMRGLTSKEISHMKNVYEKLQGSYREEELAPIEAMVWGQALMSLKRWLPRLMFNLIHSKRQELNLGAYRQVKGSDGQTRYMVNPETNEKIPLYEWHAQTQEGKYRSLVRAIKIIAKNPLRPGKQLKELDEHEQRNVLEAVLTISMWVGGYLAWAFGADDDDKKTAETKWVKRYLIDNLSQQYHAANLGDNIVNLGNVVAFQKAYSLATNFGTFAMSLAMHDLTQEGNYRGAKQLARDVPFVGSIYSSYVMINNSTFNNE